MSEDIKAKHTALKEKIKELEKEIIEITKLLLEEEFGKLFKKCPGLESLSWKQFTPYFNDGDSCEFGVYDINEVNDINVDEGEGEFKISDKDVDFVIKEGNDIIQSQTIMCELFGDSKKVKVKKVDEKIIFITSSYTDHH